MTHADVWAAAPSVWIWHASEASRRMDKNIWPKHVRGEKKEKLFLAVQTSGRPRVQLSAIARTRVNKKGRGREEKGRTSSHCIAPNQQNRDFFPLKLSIYILFCSSARSWLCKYHIMGPAIRMRAHFKAFLSVRARPNLEDVLFSNALATRTHLSNNQTTQEAFCFLTQHPSSSSSSWSEFNLRHLHTLFLPSDSHIQTSTPGQTLVPLLSCSSARLQSAKVAHFVSVCGAR